MTKDERADWVPVVVASFYEEGFVRPDVEALSSMIEQHRPMLQQFISPNWVVALFAPTQFRSLDAPELLDAFEQLRVSRQLEREVSVGVSSGDVFLVRNANGDIVRWPVGGPMSSSGKRALEAAKTASNRQNS